MDEEINIADFLYEAETLPVNTENDIEEFGQSLGLDLTTVQRQIYGAKSIDSSTTTGTAVQKIIDAWSKKCPNAPMHKLVRAMERMLSKRHRAVRAVMTFLSGIVKHLL